MVGTEAIYWASVATVVYAYAGYPLALAALAGLRPRPIRVAKPGAGRRPSVSVVLPVYNEAAAVARRVREFTSKVVDAGLEGEVVVVSDGSTDATAEAARGFEGGGVPVRVVELTVNVGKAGALTAGCLAARHEVVALADARQTWADDALLRLLENFDDPEVGGVGGALEVESEPGVLTGVGLYWRYETWLRRTEGLVHSTVGVSGSICAVRRALFRPVPAGTLLDDVYWPLCVVMQGRRVVFDGRARAFDRLPDDVGSEFRRKVRTLAGNFQLVARLPGSLSPLRNPVWFAFASHKLLRLAVPWALLASLGASAAAGGRVYSGLFLAEAAALAVGLAGLVPGAARRSRLASAAGSFLVLNAAAWVSFWVWALGRSSRSWTKTAYRPARGPSPAYEGAAR